MVRNEPSDRQDRRIQRRKMREMWRSLNEEKARMAMLPGRNPKTVHYLCREGEVADDVVPAMMWMVIAAVALATVIVLTV